MHYKYYNLDKEEFEELYSDYLEECLFRESHKWLEICMKQRKIKFSTPELWYNAKSMFQYLCREKRPEHFLSVIHDRSLDKNYFTDDQFFIAGNLILLCIYAMMKTTKNPRYDEMQNIIRTNYNCHFNLDKQDVNITDLYDNLLDSPDFEFDYDYEEARFADIRIHNYSGPVIVELFLRLCEKYKIGTEATVQQKMELLGDITGWSAGYLNKLASVNKKKDLAKSNSVEIKDLNQLLKSMNIEVELPLK